jgi:hypothetical protein
MRKISVCAAGVAVLILIGIGTWTGVGTETLTVALAPSTVDSFAMMVSTTDRPTIEYVDYTFVFTAD